MNKALTWPQNRCCCCRPHHPASRASKEKPKTQHLCVFLPCVTCHRGVTTRRDLRIHQCVVSAAIWPNIYVRVIKKFRKWRQNAQVQSKNQILAGSLCLVPSSNLHITLLCLSVSTTYNLLFKFVIIIAYKCIQKAPGLVIWSDHLTYDDPQSAK